MALTPPVRAEIVSLDATVAAVAIGSGAELGGRSVASVTITLSDGSAFSRTFTMLPTREDAGDEPKLSEREQSIVEVLQASETPMTRKQIAREMGLANHNGSFGQTVSRLQYTQVIFEQDGEYTDDVSKFEDSS